MNNRLMENKMNRIVFLMVLLIVVIAGCNEQQQKDSVEVTISGNGQFPSYLVGTWRCEEGRWSFTFDKDGKILIMNHAQGDIELYPGKRKELKMLDNKKGFVEPGQWYVKYEPDSEELMVEIEIDHLYMEMGDDILEGSRRDRFIGKVSDNQKAWNVDWYSETDMTAYLPEPVEIDTPFERSYMKTLLFEKYEE
jgi:uncharacterized lipoprotein NlpE involved in copper resistance